MTDTCQHTKAYCRIALRPYRCRIWHHRWICSRCGEEGEERCRRNGCPMCGADKLDNEAYFQAKADKRQRERLSALGGFRRVNSRGRGEMHLVGNGLAPGLSLLEGVLSPDDGLWVSVGKGGGGKLTKAQVVLLADELGYWLSNGRLRE